MLYTIYMGGNNITSIRYMKQTKINRRGSVLVYTLFILGILLVGALSMALVMVVQERSSSDTQQSIQAFQYANTGAEMAVSVSRNKAADIESINDLASEIGHATCSNGVITVDPGGFYTYEIRFLDEVSGNLVHMGNCADNLEDAEEVRSVGTFREATRAIQIPYDFCGGPSSIPISTCSDLEDVASGGAGHPIDGNYCLARDIDCGGYGGRSRFTPIPTFAGTLDGMRNKIINLSIRITSNSRDHVGLFEEIGNGAIIRNLAFEEAQIDVDNSGVGSDIHIGTLAGYLNGGTVENISVSLGTVDVDVRRSAYVGGLVGKMDGGGSVHFSQASSDISVVKNLNHAAGGLGGLVGWIADGLLGKSFATGAVSMTGGSSSRIAGLVGVLDTSATVRNCYSTGAITNGDDGLVGESSSGATVSSSYWDRNTSGKNSSAEGDGRTTAQMKQASTYTGWDFVDIWQIDETRSYPCFNWQGNVSKCPI